MSTALVRYSNNVRITWQKIVTAWQRIIITQLEYIIGRALQKIALTCICLERTLNETAVLEQLSLPYKLEMVWDLGRLYREARREAQSYIECILNFCPPTPIEAQSNAIEFFMHR